MSTPAIPTASSSWSTFVVRPPPPPCPAAPGEVAPFACEADGVAAFDISQIALSERVVRACASSSERSQARDRR